MIGHTDVAVSNFAKSKEFYSKSLAPLGYKILAEIPAAVTGTEDVAGGKDNGKPGPRSQRLRKPNEIYQV